MKNTTVKTLMLSLFVLLSSFFGHSQNNCLDFDGSNDYVVNSNASNLVSGDFTVELWCNSDIWEAGGNWNSLVSWRTGTNKNWQLIYLNGTITLWYNSNIEIPFGISPTTDQWHHLALVRDGNNWNLLLDGVLVSQQTNSTAITTYTYDLNIGASGFGDGNFNGKIDEVRIWNDVRTTSEIRTNMYRELPDPSSEGDLVAYFKLNESSGTTASDSKGSYNGTLTNMAGTEWTTSPAFFGPENCLNFDGTDDIIVHSDAANLVSGDFTVELWCNSDIWEEGGNWNSLVSWRSGTNKNWQLIYIGGTIAVWYNANISISFGISPTTNQWHHLALVRDGNNWNLFLDGILVSQQTNSTPITTNTYDLNIGASGFNDGYFNGKIDEVRIWNDDRTTTQIREYMCRTLTGNESGLVAYYNGDNIVYDSSAELYKLPDYSGNNKDGTVLNGTASSSSSAFNTWLNTSSASWSTNNNWSRSIAPASNENIGVYTYTGGTNVSVSGSPTVDNIVLGSSSSLTLSSAMTINGNLVLESDLYLNGQTITLGSNAILIEDSGSLSGSSGSITTTRTLSNINENVAGLGAEISTSANMGSTTITRTHGAASEPVSIQRRYQITPTTNTGLNATLVFHYSDEELNGLTESSLELFKSYDGNTWIHQGSSSASTNNNTITLTGINEFSHWTASNENYTTGNALDFDGNDEYVHISTFSPTLTAGTIEFWINPDQITNENARLISRGVNFGSGDEIYLMANNGRVNTTAFISGSDLVSTNPIPVGVWTHIAITADGTGSKLYINGVLDDTGGAADFSFNTFRIGGQYTAGYWETFDGKLDEVRVWSVIRTAKQIGEALCNTLAGNESGLVAYYNFNSSSGTTLYDNSGNGNDGALSNMEQSDWVNSDAFTSWTGAIDNDMEKDGNWTDGIPDSSSDNVGITTDGTSPSLSAETQISILVVETGALIDISSNSFIVNSNILNYGTITNSGTIINNSSSSVLINGGTLNDNGSVTLNDLTNVSGGNIAISSGNEMTINGDLDNSGTLSINSDASSNGSLIANGTSSGDITYDRYLLGNKWHLVSSPVGSQDLYDFVTEGNDIATYEGKYGIAPYNNSVPGWGHFLTGSIIEDGNFIDGKGYEMMAGSTGTVSFTGTVATGNVSIGITSPASPGNPWNLVGNPYPSALFGNNPADGTNNFMSVNTADLEDSHEAIYIWDAAADVYRTINHSSGATYIAPGQAFFIYSVSGGGTVEFTENMQTHQTGNIFKSSADGIPAIRLIAQKGSEKSSTSIKFIEGTTTGLDPGYDAGRFSGGSNSFAVYTHLVGDESNTVDFDIQCLPPDEYEHVIPVGLNAPANSEISFSAEIENLPGDVPVILEDRDAKVFTPLQEEGSTYSFSLSTAVEGTGRFFIHTGRSSGVNVVSLEEIKLIPDPQNNYIRILGDIESKTLISVYDLGGRRLKYAKLEYGKVNELQMEAIKSGVYIIVLSTPTETTGRKLSWIR